MIFIILGLGSVESMLFQTQVFPALRMVSLDRKSIQKVWQYSISLRSRGEAALKNIKWHHKTRCFSPLKLPTAPTDDDDDAIFYNRSGRQRINLSVHTRNNNKISTNILIKNLWPFASGWCCGERISSR